MRQVDALRFYPVIREMLARGAKRIEVAAILGLTVNMVAVAIRQMRDAGEIPERSLKKIMLECAGCKRLFPTYPSVLVKAPIRSKGLTCSIVCRQVAGWPGSPKRQEKLA